jgi:hypothetical protein
VIEKNLVNIWGAILALCLALLELSKAKGGPMTGLARVPGGAGETLCCMLRPLEVEPHQQGMPRNQGAFALDVSSCPANGWM